MSTCSQLIIFTFYNCLTLNVCEINILYKTYSLFAHLPGREGEENVYLQQFVHDINT